MCAFFPDVAFPESLVALIIGEYAYYQGKIALIIL